MVVQGRTTRKEKHKGTILLDFKGYSVFRMCVILVALHPPSLRVV